MDAIFRLAEASDAQAVFDLYVQATAHMCENGIEQWDERYPTEEILFEDIANGEMYVLTRGDDILSAVVLNDDQDDEYAAGDWRCGEHAAVIHRLCVHPKFQRQGIAKEMVRYAERLFVQWGYDCIRLDAFTQNPHALRLYEGFGYTKTGEVTYRKGQFVLMEKALAPECDEAL